MYSSRSSSGFLEDFLEVALYASCPQCPQAAKRRIATILETRELWKCPRVLQWGDGT